jgi:phosphoribosylanthranilate isomerase
VTPVRIKVCCIATAGEARAAVRHGASLVGLVSAMPSGPGVIDESLIGEIAATVPPGVTSVLLTSRTDPAEIADQQRRTRVGAIQLCDRLDPDARAALRSAVPGVRLIQVVHVEGAPAVAEAVEAARGADALLLDSGQTGGEVRELGGTGRTHDWELSRAVVESVTVPVLLAGGLHPDNVAEAIRRVGPWGVDVCSGLRVAGRLDESRLERFVRAVGKSAPLSPL